MFSTAARRHQLPKRLGGDLRRCGILTEISLGKFDGYLPIFWHIWRIFSAGYLRRNDNYANLVWHAQWWAPSFIELADGSEQIIFIGRRWLSGPNLPEGCFDICSNGPPLGHGDKAACQNGGEHYLMRSDKSVWYPLKFNEETGDILPMRRLDSYTLDLPVRAGSTSPPS